MGTETGIAWCDHTFNPWMGCEKISAGCRNCYAEKLVTNRFQMPVWGAKAPRQVKAEAGWKDPVKWNRAAVKEGVRKRVFCASLADVFEDYQGPSRDAVIAARSRLWALIEQTPMLDWLLVTKRAENMGAFVPLRWFSRWPRNVWAGCTVENQEQAAERLPHLRTIPAAVRFVSYEPALECINWAEWLCHDNRSIDWLIVGGESGPGARPFNPIWAGQAVDRCQEAGVPVFVKGVGADRADVRGDDGGGSRNPDTAAVYVYAAVDLHLWTGIVGPERLVLGG